MSEKIWDAEQKEAIAACCDVDRRVVAVTGQAGTGKTSLFHEVYHQLTAAGYNVGVAGPTGKSVRRIKDTGLPMALTYHKLLEYSHPGEKDPKTGKPMGVSIPKRDKQNPLEYDVILADEYAMVNQEIHRNLFDALKYGARIRVFGDINQLRPIEENKRLQDEPSSFSVLLDKFKGITLKTIHRQGDGSGIVANGTRIIQGRIPQRGEDFQITTTDNPVDALSDYMFECLDNDIDFASIKNQVIVLGHKSWVGTMKLNARLQNIFRPEKDGWVELPRHPWYRTEEGKEAKLRVRAGDKVIQTSNNYELEVFNGEVGIILEVTDFGEVIIDFGDREMVIPPVMEVPSRDGGTRMIDPRKDLELAYAITTHKMQGSEAEHVVYIMNKSNIYMQNRNNFYTGITRAKKHVHVITDMRSLSNSVTRKG